MVFHCHSTLTIGILGSFFLLYSIPVRLHVLYAPLLHYYIMCYLLIEAGYFDHWYKISVHSFPVFGFLGFICDSTRSVFLIPDDKKTKFAVLRENILSSTVVTLKTLKRFPGKVISSSLAVPAWLWNCSWFSKSYPPCLDPLAHRSSCLLPFVLKSSIGGSFTIGQIAFIVEKNIILL